MFLSQKALGISESLTLSIDAKAKRMKSEGLDVIGFGAGEPDFNTPEYIIQAAKDALDKGMTKYTPTSGIPQLKKEICNKLYRDNGLSYHPEEIIVSNGAKHSLYNIFQAVLDPGDEVIIPKPYWLSYPEMVKMAGGVAVYADTREENDFKITADELIKSVTPRTKAFILNNPSNPTGCVYDEKELRDIADIAVANNFLVISDEIYEELIYDGKRHISIASLNDDIKNRTITVNGMSKAYAMTGWRIGYAAGPKDIITAMTNIQSHSTSNPNAAAQYASMAALEGTKDFISRMRDEFGKRRSYMVNKINSMGCLSCRQPSGAFYIMMNIAGTFGKCHGSVIIDSSISFADALLESKMVTVVPGIAFGSDSHVRLSYATSMINIEKGLNRIEEFVKELK